MSQKNNDFFNQFLNNELPKETPLESKPYEKAFTQQPVKSTPTPKIEVDLRQTVKSEPEKVEVNSPKGPGVSIKTDEKYERFINPNKKRNQIIALITGAVAVLSVIFYLIFGNKVEVPDFSAYTPSQIATWGTKNNMTMLYVEEYNHEFEKGTLISQNIAPGKKVKKGGEMTLVMSLGIDPEVIVTLPDFDETWTTDELMNW
ncbi:PASTA domain-containing protein, partial [Turicibacter sanguinis]|nr:PASTA domain-containing protein [Turicibacter sanguinis]